MNNLSFVFLGLSLAFLVFIFAFLRYRRYQRSFDPDQFGEEFEALLAAMERVEQGPKRPLLYLFQHVALPQAAFENHPELLRGLSGKKDLFPLHHIWSKARARGELTGLISESEDSLEDEAQFAKDEELYRAVSIHPRQVDGWSIFVIVMPAPERAPEAYYAAIVYREHEPREPMQPSASTRYFTLERADIVDRTMFCEWTKNGSHLNFGEGPTPTVDGFVQVVTERIRSVK